MNLEYKVYLKIIKEKLLPKYGLDLDMVSFQYIGNSISVYYLVNRVEQDKLYDFYKKMEKFYEEADLLCKVVTQENLNNLKVFCDKFNNNEKNLLLLI